jgi:hypothetical protein
MIFRPILAIVFFSVLSVWSPKGFAGPEEDVKRIEELQLELVALSSESARGLSPEDINLREELYGTKLSEIDRLSAKLNSSYMGKDKIGEFNFLPLLNFVNSPQTLAQSLVYLRLSTAHAQLGMDYLLDMAVTSANTLVADPSIESRALNGTMDAIEEGIQRGNFQTSQSLKSLMEFADIKTNTLNAVYLNDVVNRALLKWLDSQPSREEVWEVFTRQPDPIVQLELKDKPAFLQIVPNDAVFDFVLGRGILNSIDDQIDFLKKARSRYYVFSKKMALQLIDEASSSAQRRYVFSKSDFKTKIILLERFFEMGTFNDATEPLDLLSLIDPLSGSAREVSDISRSMKSRGDVEGESWNSRNIQYNDALQKLMVQNRDILRWVGVKYYRKYRNLGATVEQLHYFRKQTEILFIHQLASSLWGVQRPVGLDVAEYSKISSSIKSCRALFQ